MKTQNFVRDRAERDRTDMVFESPRKGQPNLDGRRPGRARSHGEHRAHDSRR